VSVSCVGIFLILTHCIASLSVIIVLFTVILTVCMTLGTATWLRLLQSVWEMLQKFSASEWCNNC